MNKNKKQNNFVHKDLNLQLPANCWIVELSNSKLKLKSKKENGNTKIKFLKCRFKNGEMTFPTVFLFNFLRKLK